jgi:hypothetical protein
MRHNKTLFVVFVMVLVLSSACEQTARQLSVSPDSFGIGGITAQPGNVPRNGQVVLTWSPAIVAGSNDVVEACDPTNRCAVIATSGITTNHNPSTSGTWKYQKRNTVDDITARLQATVVVN